MPNIDDFRKEVAEKRAKILAQMARVPIAALIWGPNPTSADPYAQARLRLRDELSTRGHLADFSEDLHDSSFEQSNFAQQISQAEAYDVIFSIPSSVGSIAEIHDFARIQGISHKIIAFVDRNHLGGYSGQSLVNSQANSTCKIELYDYATFPDCVISLALDQIRRLQEIFYIGGRR